MNPREAAVLSLNSAFKNGRFVNLELDSTIKKYGFEDKDKSFYTRLLYGTVEKKLTLDWYLSKISKTALADIEPLVRCILETALYQIFEMDRVPDSAACNEATELVKKLCPGSYAGFVNAILRNTIRQKAALRAELQTLPGLPGTSVRHSIPLWICQKWESDYGQGSAEQIAHGFESIPPHLTLHINTLKITADEYLAKLDASLCPRKIGETLITLSGSAPVESLPGFEEGLFFIQDESSALCAALVSASVAGISAPTVIDTCACPGGKTFAIAIANRDRGTLYSFDLHANRLSLIERGTNRLGISSVRTQARDARQPDTSLFGQGPTQCFATCLVQASASLPKSRISAIKKRKKSHGCRKSALISCAKAQPMSSPAAHSFIRLVRCAKPKMRRMWRRFWREIRILRRQSSPFAVR